DLATRDTIARPSLEAAIAWLMVLDGGTSQLQVNQRLMIEGRATVGRGHECDVVIDDPSVSTVHAAVYFVTAHWVVEDYESMNGTYASGKPVTSVAVVNNGDLLQFGRVRMRMLC
ncbi:MAG: FHA domain-containing protein, partial [Thermomicrobiales bacterium]